MATAFDAGQVLLFIKLLTGNENSPVTWQVFYDPKGEKRDDLAARFVATYSQAEQFIKKSQDNYCGVYIGINGADGQGRKANNIVDFRAVAADIDGGALPASFPLQPHIVSQRDPLHSHVVWRVAGIDGAETFRALQKRIALYFDSDQSVTNADRVLRAPGTLHFKNKDAPAQYKVVSGHEGRVYSVAEIISAFTLTPDKQAELDRWLSTRDAHDHGTGFADNDVARQRMIKFLTIMAEPAVVGNGTATLIRVAGYGYDQGLPLEVTQALMWQYYDPRCVPSWASTGEKDHFYEVVERAYRYARNEPGCKTAVAAFSQLDPIPIPPPPPTIEEVIRTGDRLSKVDASILLPMMNAKSAHYELAKVFDGVVYDGTNLVCCEKIFYEYNGRSWSILSDQVLESAIQRFYKQFKPADSLTSGIFKVLRTLVNVRSVENGTWLNSGKVAPDIVCFKNGLVDLSTNPPTIIAHTPSFFTFNELRYDYHPGSSCPTWLRFLGEVFEYDPVLIDQLQEWMGYCLVSDVSLQKFSLFVGKSRAGKGVITTVIREMVGEHNTTAPSLNKFAKDSALHKMSVASVGLIPDAHSVTPNSRDEVLSNFKAITGGDPMDYHVMYKGTQTTVFKIKLIMSTNGMPEFSDPSGALVNRMLVFPFRKSFADRQDRSLPGRLIAEIQGIAQWALVGLERLKRQGKFTEATTGLREKECIAEDLNPIARFLQDVCQYDTEAFVTSEQLYRTYMLWAKQHDVMHPLSQNKVVREINSSPVPIVQARTFIDGKQARGFKGLRLVKFDSV